MCSYIVEKAALVGSAKGRKGWMRIDTANVYFDHPYYSTLDHVLAIDFTNEGEGGRDRVAVELSAESLPRLRAAKRPMAGWRQRSQVQRPPLNAAATRAPCGVRGGLE